MSELRVAEIHNPNDQTGGIEIDNNDVVSINGQAQPTAGALGNRNLIINGAMQIAQRGDDVDDVTTTGYRTCDRFRASITNLGTWTVQQSTESPDGFANSFRMLCTTADASPAAADFCLLNYFVEGFDCQRLLDTGTTTHPMRLSFWVRSNRTGDASVSLLQSDNASRMFSASYNIAAADTWEHQVIEIPVDTAAAFDNDNGEGMNIGWHLNSGSNSTGGTHSAGWVPFDATARNATNLGVGTAVNDDFFITGVQLEVGTNATAFEWRSHAAELALCQRYFQKIDYRTSNGGTDTNAACWFWYPIVLPVTMNRGPTLINNTAYNSDTGTGEFTNAGNVGGTGLALESSVPTQVIVRGNNAITMSLRGRLWLESEL